MSASGHLPGRAPHSEVDVHKITAGDYRRYLCDLPSPGSIVDISNSDYDEMKVILSKHIFDSKDYVLFKIFDRRAFIISGEEIIDSLDKLWRPSSDDVLILDEAFRPLILIDHEEKISLFS